MRWLARIDGAMTPLTIYCVGDGPYGLMEIKRCEGTEKRTLTFFGFRSAQEALAYAEYAKERAVHQEDDLPAGGQERENAKIALEEHVREHIEFAAICLNYAITDEALEQLVGIGQLE